MKVFRVRVLVILSTFVMGLVSVSFFRYLSDRWIHIPVNLPVIEGETPLFLFPNYNFLSGRKLIDQRRDFSAYDFGGRHSNCNFLDDSELSKCKADLVKTRKFLFQHWKEKKRAYIFVTFQEIDWERDAHIYIEPDETGNWHIVLIWEEYGSTPLKQTESFAIAIKNLKFRRATGGNFDIGTRYLSFTNEKDKEIDAV